MFQDGIQIWKIAEHIFPICRSITGNGVRDTLKILKQYVPEIEIHEIPSGTPVFDWVVPKEWNITGGGIWSEDGSEIINFNKNNLHIMGYSIPVDCWMELNELLKYIYVQEEQETVIPYVTSYYRENFGFCMSKNQRDSLKEGQYHVVINSSLEEGTLTYGEVVLQGELKEEIFFSTYVCHPSMGNNECSGPALAAYLVNWVKRLKKRRYTYRFIFVPETIGAITYLSRNIQHLKRTVVAGFNLSCVGDNKNYSMVESRYGNTLADRVLKNILKYRKLKYHIYSFLERGSDERQYNAPGVDLPVVSFCRSKYGEYEEYHTSADDMAFICPEGFQGSFDVMCQCIIALENNDYYYVKVLCEPQLGKRGLYPTISKKENYGSSKDISNFLAYADGKNDLLEISERIHISCKKCIDIANVLLKFNLIEGLNISILDKERENGCSNNKSN